MAIDQTPKTSKKKLPNGKRRRQNFKEALEATNKQFATTLARLAK